MKREIVENYTYCSKDNIFKDMKDNPERICDCKDGSCFRDKKHRIISDVVNCSKCIFYTPKPDDPLIGLCDYKQRNEVVFEDDFCSRGERSNKDV